MALCLGFLPILVREWGCEGLVFECGQPGWGWGTPIRQFHFRHLHSLAIAHSRAWLLVRHAWLCVLLCVLHAYGGVVACLKGLALVQCNVCSVQLVLLFLAGGGQHALLSHTHPQWLCLPS